MFTIPINFFSNLLGGNKWEEITETWENININWEDIS